METVKEGVNVGFSEGCIYGHTISQEGKQDTGQACMERNQIHRGIVNLFRVGIKPSRDCHGLCRGKCCCRQGQGICKWQNSAWDLSLLSSEMLRPKESWAPLSWEADSHITGGRVLWTIIWTRLEVVGHLWPFYSPAYLAYDILQDVLCHLDENIHNMMCLGVLVVNMPE